jgi:flagellar hook-associated protein 2
MAGIASLGIGSGLDLNGLVKNLVESERAPRANQLNRSEAKLTAQLSAFGSLRSSISDLADKFEALKDLEPGRAATTSDKSAVSVSAQDTAALGTFSIEVTSLAAAQSLAATAVASRTDPFGQGTLDFTFGDGSVGSVAIGPDDDSLEGIRDAINEADIGVTAGIVNDGSGYRLTISSDKTGLDNSVAEIVVTESGAAGLSGLAYSESGGASNLTQTQPPEDAGIVVNGLPVSSATNDFEGVLDGATLTVKEETTSPVTIEISEDRAAVRRALQGFVEAYNTFNTTARDLTSYDAENNRASTLTGDSTVRSAVGALRSTVTDAVGGDGAIFNALAEIGITGNRNGELSIDTEALNDALESNFDGVVSLSKAFGAAAEDVAGRFSDSSGLIAARTDGIKDRLDRITDDRANLDERIALLEARLTKQFAGLDSLLSNLSQQGDFLTQQLASIPQPGAS